MFRNQALIVLVLLAITLAVYGQVGNLEFLNYDDDVYVSDNNRIHDGLSVENIRWAFTTGYASNWHPLTWLSHLLDCELYGLNPRGHHLTNLLFHLVSTVLLFLALNKMTGAVGRSAFVAALFAIHPLHVESVAWVAERKDVLSGCFWMLTMVAYAHYAKHPRPKNYLLVVVAFALGLMAKSMLVTLPFVLLLMDYWPLARLRTEPPATGGAWARYWPLIREKIPLFTLAAASCIVTLLVQQRGGAVKPFETVPLLARIGNAPVSYTLYLAKAFWPTRLAVLYPHRGSSLPLTWVAGAGVLLLVLTILATRAAKRRPYLLVGWFWYLGTLVPVIGVVQVGYQALADRYTYLPLVGIFLIVAWGVPDLLAGWKHAKRAVPAAAVAALVVLMVCCWFQVRYWRNSETLFRHASRVTSRNTIAHTHLAITLFENGRYDEAVDQYLQILEFDPGHKETHNNLGVLLARQDDFDGAIEHYSKALSVDSNYVEARVNLGFALAAQERFEDAFAQYERALETRTRRTEAHAVAHYLMAVLLEKQAEPEVAARHYEEALKINPNNGDAHFRLGKILEALGRPEQARRHYQEAHRLNSGHTNAGQAIE